MGTGIGKYCVRCGDQLDYEVGFTYNEKFCEPCEKVVKFELMSMEEKKALLESPLENSDE